MMLPVRHVYPSLLCLLCLFSLSAVPAQSAGQFTGSVISVSDGDTISVLESGKQQVKIRLYGIDCPESGQAFGMRAKQATSDAVFGKQVVVQPIDTDHYGRTVAIVGIPGGKSLNERLVRDGLAWVYSQHCTREDICEPLRKLEKAARISKRGLWSDKAPVPPWEWKKLRGVRK